ncbi:MAG: molybdopterin-dependent oxidoreductase [Curvibacter sp.]|jgi:hypothetical protein|nr:molybdopterin-dependent oxidoreductase [Curvibacter sp.]
MKKREFLAATGTLALLASSHAAVSGAGGPPLLTVSGAIGRGNRGPLDPALDQMMVKQKLGFERAHTFDFGALAALPATTVRPTLEYDGKVHALRGPLLVDVLRATGAATAAPGRVLLRAIDGYTVPLTLALARQYGFIVATHLDGKPMPLGGLGPLWAVYDADAHADMASKPLGERFALCPWGLYYIEVLKS